MGATGGHIRQYGLYTAGQEPGLFEVSVAATLPELAVAVKQHGLVSVAVPPVWVPAENVSEPRFLAAAT